MLFSIIMPAYNCADTIDNAVKSITSQHFSDYEIIIVDDGSTDTTPEIVDKMHIDNPNVKPFHIDNSGPANARNYGITKAVGDYILFIDSDDEFSVNSLDVISKAVGECDLLIFGFRQRFFSKAEDKIYSADKSSDIDSLYRNNLLNQVWNKAYNRKFLVDSNISFSDYRYGEDRLFNVSVLKHSPAVNIISDVLYYYNIDNGVSLISGYIKGKFDASKEIYCEFYDLCNDKNTAKYMFLKNVVSCMTVLFADNCSLTKNEKLSEIRRILNDYAVKNAMNEKINDSRYSEIIRKILISGNVKLNYNFSKAIAECQKHFLPLFLKFRG